MHWDIGVLGGMALLTCDCSQSSWSHENYMEGEMGTLIFTVKNCELCKGRRGVEYNCLYFFEENLQEN